MRMNWFLALLAGATIAVAIGCRGPAPEMTADTIYTGGDIITVNEALPTVKAVAVKDGKILAVGARGEIERAYKGSATTVVDLAGKTLLPGFIDPHSHYIENGVGPREVADALEDFCRKGQYYGLKVHFFVGPKNIPSRQGISFGYCLQTVMIYNLK